MKRRELLNRSFWLGAAALSLPTTRLFAADDGYAGPLLAVFQADGGWDVTSYCDPKVNVSGQPDITNWSSTSGIQTAGNIAYAPFGNNAWFFDKYMNDMVVINGVDAQTNSHTTGVLHNWSGRNARGFPTITAMFAAHQASTLPLAYINYGGFGDTANLIRFSRLNDVNSLRQLLNTNQRAWDPTQTDRNPDDMARIRAFRRARNARMLDNEALLARTRDNLQAYDSALAAAGELERFADFVPDDADVLPRVTVNPEIDSNLPQQVQLTAAAFEAGVASAADLFLSGFDTHQNHDSLHEPLLSHLNEGIDLLWTMAEARGFAERLTVVIGSDFARTPRYNADNGKDHWPIGSVIVMQKNAIWGNRQVGFTDEGHNAFGMDPATLQVDETNGTIIYPKHVHKALRRLLGVEGTAVESGLEFRTTEDFGFFNPSVPR